MCIRDSTWDGSEKPTRMTADEVIKALDALGTYDYVTLSGGNPALLAANMAELVSKLKARGVTPVSYTHLDVYKRQILRILSIKRLNFGFLSKERAPLIVTVFP